CAMNAISGNPFLHGPSASCCFISVELFNFYTKVGLAQRNHVAELQADTARTGRNSDGFTVSKEARSMRTAIVANAIRPRRRCALDMSMMSGHSEVGSFGALLKRNMVCPDQTIATIAKFRTPAQVYPGIFENV